MTNNHSTIIKLHRPVFLIGPTCVGKSTIARQLAKRYHVEQVDLDIVIEEHTGVDIQTIFDYEGEKGFRAYETLCLQVVAKQSKIIAVGAGCILSEENRQIMQQHGSIVYLSAPIDILIKNFFNSKRKNRPLLQDEEPKFKLQKMHQLRTPMYESVADLEIVVSGRTTRQICEKIFHFLQA